jgi:cytochrome bd-type quinol oxidase subunit 2
MLFFCSAGVVSKRLIPKSTRGWRWFFRATLPMHPVVLGMAFGMLPGAPVSEGVEGTTARVVYYALAGLCATWSYDIARQWSKAKGYHLPSGDSIPPL